MLLALVAAVAVAGTGAATEVMVAMVAEEAAPLVMVQLGLAAQEDKVLSSSSLLEDLLLK
jgi:hypothetical protein